MDTEAFLEHHGVKGMKWGVRRRSSKNASSGPTRIKLDHTPGKGVKVSGGDRLPAHRDAKKAAVAAQKAKASGTHSLSNSELKLLLNRLDMEQKFLKMNPPKKGAKGFVLDALKGFGDQELNKLKRGDLSTLNAIDAFLNQSSAGKHRKGGRKA